MLFIDSWHYHGLTRLVGGMPEGLPKFIKTSVKYGDQWKTEPGGESYE